MSELLDLAGNARAVEGRSTHWAAVERMHLHHEPVCQMCGGRTNLQVHHVLPFHQHPELELDPTNLITLCQPHHLLAGHLMRWAAINSDVRADAAHWRARIASRKPG